MSRYLQDALARQTAARAATPQSEPVPGRETEQVKNSAGGYTFQLDAFARLDRFLILGSEGGTYYATEKDLTKQNITTIEKLVESDGLRVVERVVEISTAGRAPKNEPALLVLAMCAGAADLATRQAALEALPKVARIGTHLFHFAQFVQAYRGWGRALRRAVAKWYTTRSPEDLTMQVVKYRQRDGWSHRDLMRLSHPSPRVSDEARRRVLQWVTHPELVSGGEDDLLGAAINLMAATDENEAARLIRNHGLPRECVPTDLLNSYNVWEALLEKMPMMATIRNLGKMTSIGLVKPLSVASRQVIERLSNETAIRRARVHPIAILIALKTYSMGRGVKGSLTWKPVQPIVDALDKAFYMAFKSVEPTGKSQLLAVDVSGSMGSNIIADTFLSAREGAAAMALVLANIEPNHHIIGFTSSGSGWKRGNGVSPLEISPRMRLDTVVRYMAGLSFGGTDCSLPMLYAAENNLQVDAFTTITDNETWAGRMHPFQALTQYRQQTGIPAKSVVVGMTATNFTIADPSDPGMLDIVGFDADAPQLISDFIR